MVNHSFHIHVFGQKYRDPMSVKDHYKFVHESMRFACEVYERQFRNQTNLKRRNKTFHETSSEEVPPCAECGKLFKHPSALPRHFKRAHDECQCEECSSRFLVRLTAASSLLEFHAFWGKISIFSFMGALDCHTRLSLQKAPHAFPFRHWMS